MASVRPYTRYASRDPAETDCKQLDRCVAGHSHGREQSAYGKCDQKGQKDATWKAKIKQGLKGQVVGMRNVGRNELGEFRKVGVKYQWKLARSHPR